MLTKPGHYLWVFLALLADQRVGSISSSAEGNEPALKPPDETGPNGAAKIEPIQREAKIP